MGPLSIIADFIRIKGITEFTSCPFFFIPEAALAQKPVYCLAKDFANKRPSSSFSTSPLSLPTPIVPLAMTISWRGFDLSAKDEEESGDFNQAELDSLKPQVWKLPKKALPWSGRRGLE